MVEYLKVGMRLDAVYKDDGKYHRATIAGINPKKKKAPVKVHYIAKKADAWVSLDMIKFKALPKEPESEAPFGATIPIMARKYLLVKAKVYARLDPGICPFFLAEEKYLAASKESTEKITWAIAHEGGCARSSLPVLPDDRESDTSAYLAGVVIQEMVSHRPASSLILCGPSRICKFLEKCFSVGGAYEYAARSLPIARGTPDKPFEVNIVQDESDLPPAFDAKEDARRGHLAFDVGGIKTAAGKECSKDGECEVSKEEDASLPFGATMPPLAKKLLVDAYLKATKECTKKIQWALCHENGCLRYSLPVFPEERESDTSAYLVGVLIEEMIWQRRASSLILRGPPKICQFLQKSYSVGGAYEYLVKPMAHARGTPDKPFEVKIVQDESDLPPAFDAKAPTLLTSPPRQKAHRKKLLAKGSLQRNRRRHVQRRSASAGRRSA
ncbi:SPAC4G8.04 [Symbiodinium sp. CCMP2592]|nr:SPAC4G8.04 [Symbiodinium sp. CCMP2592]